MSFAKMNKDTLTKVADFFDILIDPTDGLTGVLLARDVEYRGHRGEGSPPTDAAWVTFTPTTATYALPAMLGLDT